MLHRLQDYYPEHLGTMFVINTPLIFRGIWAAVQPLLQVGLLGHQR